MTGLFEGVKHCDAALFQRGGGEAWEADNIAGCVDIGGAGLEVFVDFDASAVVYFNFNIG